LLLGSSDAVASMMEVNTEVEAVHEIGHLTVSHRPRLTTRRNKILNSKVLFERCDVQKSEILTTGCVSKIKYQGSCWCVLLFFSPFHDMLVGIYYSYKVSIFSIVCFFFFPVYFVLYAVCLVWTCISRWLWWTGRGGWWSSWTPRPPTARC